MKKYSHLGVEDLPDVLLENYPLNLEYLLGRTWEITAGAYKVPIVEMVNGC